MKVSQVPATCEEAELKLSVTVFTLASRCFMWPIMLLMPPHRTINSSFLRVFTFTVRSPSDTS